MKTRKPCDVSTWENWGPERVKTWSKPTARVWQIWGQGPRVRAERSRTGSTRTVAPCSHFAFLSLSRSAVGLLQDSTVGPHRPPPTLPQPGWVGLCFLPRNQTLVSLAPGSEGAHQHLCPFISPWDQSIQGPEHLLQLLTWLWGLQ